VYEYITTVIYKDSEKYSKTATQASLVLRVRRPDRWSALRMRVDSGTWVCVCLKLGTPQEQPGHEPSSKAESSVG
jgi:hypothetical protein